MCSIATVHSTIFFQFFTSFSLSLSLSLFISLSLSLSLYLSLSLAGQPYNVQTGFRAVIHRVWFDRSVCVSSVLAFLGRGRLSRGPNKALSYVPSILIYLSDKVYTTAKRFCESICCPYASKMNIGRYGFVSTCAESVPFPMQFCY